jgi:ubiquinone biosynthesis protein
MTTQMSSKAIPIRKPVSKAMNEWLLRQEIATKTADTIENYPAVNTILKSMPRRERLISSPEVQLSLPYYESHIEKGKVWDSLGRLLTWISILTSLLIGNLLDKILRRESMERSAVRLRQVLEKGGGTFVKLGQQAAMRIDLLPWEYCVELSKMLDRMLPFPFEEALEAIENTTGRPWQETFDVIDPKPIGSASIACVYQATLKNGTKVVIKVRRPGINRLFKADLRVLDWIMKLAEFLTFFRPGLTNNLRSELRNILLEELDFRREARFQDIFHNNVNKSGRTFFNAPQVYFQFSGEEVLVQEFISGLSVVEVIAAVEDNGPKGRALLRELNIDPAIVARRILWAAFWSMDEHVFFHGDPHPANIIVRPNNEITFIDFGSCGSFNNSQKIALEQMVISMKNQDVETMARSSLILMEPLPPIDLTALVKMAQDEYMKVLYTFNTPAKYTQYWERTSARQWMATIRVARKFNIPMNLHMLRMIRATLLYDSIVLRLDNQLDRYNEYSLFMKDRAEMVKLKWKQKLRDNAGDNFFLNIEQNGKALNDLMIRAQTILSKPIVSFSSTVNKLVFTISVLTRMVGRIILITIMAVGAIGFSTYLSGAMVSFVDGLKVVLQSNLYHLFLVAAIVVNFRHILFRLRDRD